MLAEHERQCGLHRGETTSLANRPVGNWPEVSTDVEALEKTESRLLRQIEYEKGENVVQHEGALRLKRPFCSRCLLVLC